MGESISKITAGGSRRTPTRTASWGHSKGALVGADVFIGVSAPDLLVGDDTAAMADKAIVLALANPDPEIHPTAAAEHAAVVATGRSDFPHQIKNVLAFPGPFRGPLHANARNITNEMQVAAAKAIADCLSPEEVNASDIISSVFDSRVAPAVAAAVARTVESWTSTAAPSPVAH